MSSESQIGTPNGDPKVSRPGMLDNFAEVIEDFEARNKPSDAEEIHEEINDVNDDDLVEVSNPENTTQTTSPTSNVDLAQTSAPQTKPESESAPDQKVITSYQGQNDNLTPEQRAEMPPYNYRGAQFTTKPADIPRAAAAQASNVQATNKIFADRSTAQQNLQARPQIQYQQQIQQQLPRPQPLQPVYDNIDVNEKGVPQDMDAAMKYLLEPLIEYQNTTLSENLLLRKKEEDEGVQQDSDFEGEDFEDLLDMFDIDPEEISLDLTLRERQRLLIESFDETQLDKYEYFRRTNLSNAGIRKLVSQLTGQSIGSEFSKILAGIGKVFVGEIVERAKDAQRRENEAKVAAQLEYKRKLRKYELFEERKKQKTQTENNTNESQNKSEEIKAKDEEDEERDEDKEDEEDEEDEEVDSDEDSYDEDEVVTKPIPPLLNIPEKSKYPPPPPTLSGKAAAYRVVIPDDNAPLTPDHIREAWRLYQEETPNVIKGRWRKQGGGDGSLFR